VEVRQRGLLMGLQMVDQSCAPLLVSLLAQNGVITIFAGLDPSVLIVMPPLTITEEEVSLVLEALDRSYEAMARKMV